MQWPHNNPIKGVDSQYPDKADGTALKCAYDMSQTYSVQLFVDTDIRRSTSYLVREGLFQIKCVINVANLFIV